MIPGVIPGPTAAAMMALIRVHARDGRASVRDVADEADCAQSTAHKRLHELAGLGLIIGLGTKGGLRPAVEWVTV